MFWDIFTVLVLTLLNGFFSMSEIALITVRKTRIASLAKQGSGRAKAIQLLQQNPESLFATIQVGISLLTIGASAFAGSSGASHLADILASINIPFIQLHAYTISFIIVVATVSYISITIGELIPKSLGLRYAEPFALFSAYPILWLSRLSYILIKVLNVTSNLFLKIFKDSTTFTESRVSEEEIRSLISEGRNAGTIEEQEHNIIENVFDFSDLSVDKIMVPRTTMVCFDIHNSAKEVVHKAIESGYSRIPMYENSLNNIVGILYTKRLLAKFEQGSENLNLREFLVPAYFVPNTMKISQVLQRLQKKKSHMALVTDEHGEVGGLVTMEDVLEEIVGDITDETDEADKSIKQQGEDFIVSGAVSVVDFNKFFKTEIYENRDYNTISGFILHKLGRFPEEGDFVDFGEVTLIVQEVTLRVVKTVIVKKIKK